MNNCHECARATDLGDKFACRWNPKKALEAFPFYPVFHVKVTRMTVSKDKVPSRDCPGFKHRSKGESP